MAGRWRTHDLDLAYKLTLEAMALAGAILAFVLAYHWRRALFDLPDAAQSAAGLLAFVGVYAGLRAVLGRTLLPPWGSALLYLRWRLAAPVTRREAQLLAFLFDGSDRGRWYPLTSVRALPPEKRRAALFAFARKVAAGYSPELAKLAAAPAATPDRPVDPMQAELNQLGLAQRPDAADQLKKAYLRKVRQFHPDRFVHEAPEARRHAEERCKRINRAYTDLRRTYA